ncbi:MAG: ABC transporter permease [Bacilli bacterium]|nr:ABC transporter permease [Bacilli bacterium]
MENENKNLYLDIPKEKFKFANADRVIHDKELETKPIGFFKDAMIRFKKNKSSVVASFIILLLVLYAIFVPIVFKNNYNSSIGDNTYLDYGKLLPKTHIFQWLGWDGKKTNTLDNISFVKKQAIGIETNTVVVSNWTKIIAPDGGVSYKCLVDSYTDLGMKTMTLTKNEYKDIQRYQNETGIQVIYPYVDYNELTAELPNAIAGKVRTNPNIWYKVNKKGSPIYTMDENGNCTFTNCYMLSNGKDNYTSLRIEDPNGPQYQYANLTGAADLDEEGHIYYDEEGYLVGDGIGYVCRVSKYFYFQYKYGFEPSFIFGTNDRGHDIFVRLAQGARFSFVLAIFVSAINLTIGAFYGAVEGYYGRATDMIMERIVEILGGIPFIVVTTLFQLHLAKHVGVVGALLFAFVATGWIGMSGTVRMQFYRFKNQEYILAARTLGAKDFRIMFKHIFPNALGTIVTSTVLVIPSVIFSESSLTYLGIINLEASKWTSVGTMLALGKDFLQTFPHIIFFPAIFISLLEISFNLFGNGLRDAFNPSLRGSE